MQSKSAPQQADCLDDSAAETLFSLRNLSVSYRAKPALRSLNWDWGPGQHWVVLGPNGAGKTALATILATEQTHFVGQYVRSRRLDAGGVAYVCFERGRKLCERDQKLDCAEYESSASDTGTRVEALLPQTPETLQERTALIKLLDMQTILDRGLRYISTGEMRKTLLASALLSKPELLILDSPLDGLDRATQARFSAALDTIMQQSPAVLLLCRNPLEVPQACTHIMLLDEGRIIATGERDEMLADPRLHKTLEPQTVVFHAPPPRNTAMSGPAEDGSRDDATLELRKVSVSFGDHCVFRDLDWRFEQNQHCMIVGPNGSGKSTLLDLLTGDNHKAYGQDVFFQGQRRGSGESVWDIKARFGRVDARMQFQVPQGSKVLEVVLSGFFDSLGLRDRPSDQQLFQGREWLKALGLSTLEGKEFHTLSFGLQRLVLLTRAMVKDPQILLLDEATISLDVGHRKLLLDAVDHVVSEERCQLLFVSHTAGERPRCINQVLSFAPEADGSRVDVVDDRQPT